MKEKSLHINGFYKTEDSSLWKWKGINKNRRKHGDKQLSVTEFFQENKQKLEEAVEGPGAGAGIGCGVGLGWGVVGGLGLGGSSWNQLKMVFGIGMGCGVGVGLGYGQGVGLGLTFDSLRSRLLQPKTNSRKPIVIQI